MGDLTILHVSDLHWAGSKAVDQSIVIDALISDLATLRADGVIPDLVVFTGDLVMAGDEPASFEEVKVGFLDRLTAATQAPLIVTAGNHDIQRSTVRASGGFIEAGLKAKLTSVDALNSFIDEAAANKGATTYALERMANFEAAYSSFGCPPHRIIGPLLKTYSLEIKGMKVGIASFNTAWRATGEADNVDRHALLLGERNVDLAVEDLSDCDHRLALFHHPLDWLSDYDNVAVSSRLYTEFDLLAFGHSHRSEPETRITAVGTAILSQAGCLYEHRDYFNGYQLIKLRPDDGEVDFIIRTYFNRPRRTFDKAVNVAPEGKCTLPYSGRTKLRNAPVDSFLRETRPVIRQAAAEQVNIVDAVTDLQLDPKEAFICPPLTLHRSTHAEGEGENKEISPDEILRSIDNFLILGHRESGKSTLGHYLAVLAAEGAIDTPRIPAVLDFRHLKITAYGLSRAIATYYGAAKQGLDIDARLQAGDFLLIIDNYASKDALARDALKALFERYPKCRWILLGDSQSSPSSGEDDAVVPRGDFRRVHIQTLPRKSIRELSRRWCEPVGLDNQKAFSAVMSQLRESNLPRTGYMVTLLLWGLYQERQFERINEALLLTYVVDHLLGKADFTEALQRNFDPTSKEITLQHLAYVLRQSAGVLPKNEVLVALVEFFKKKGLQYDASEVLLKLTACGLLIDREGLVSFKYRCFEEYFYANLLRSDSQRFEEATSNRRFIEYAREIELLAGLRRQNKDLIDIISQEVESGRPSELADYAHDRFEQIATRETGLGLSLRRLDDIRKKKLTVDQIDDLMDAAERQAAERERRAKDGKPKSPEAPRTLEVSPDMVLDAEVGLRSADPMQPHVFMQSVALLGSVVRNSEFTDATDKVRATRLHLRSSVEVMLLFADIIGDLLEELSRDTERKSALSDDDAEAIRYLLLKWFVLGTSVSVSEQIGTEKLFAIYDEIFADPEIGLAERILIGIVMLDLSHPKWVAAWEVIVEQAKGKRFILDMLMDRLWRLIHVRPLSDAERTRVEAAAERIEIEFGASKQGRAHIVKTIRDTVKETSRKDQVGI